MPDGVNFQPPPPSPPTTLWPDRGNRAELIVDTWRVMLADPDGNLIGLPAGPIARVLYAGRSETRDL